MDREPVKGAADVTKGAIRDTARKVTGDKELQAEVKFDKAQGSAHNDVADMRDVARKAREKSRSPAAESRARGGSQLSRAYLDRSTQ